MPLVGVCLFLSACGYQSEVFGPPIYEIYKMPVEEARTHLAGKTVMTFIDVYRDCRTYPVGKYYSTSCSERPGPGTQVEYLAENGQSYLWFPGNRRLVRGHWVVRRWREKYEICWSYGPNSRHFITGKRGKNLTCDLLSNYAESIAEIRREDSFSLSSGHLPFVLKRDQTTFDTLLVQAASNS
ncbi:hypothetical protein [Pelagibius sp. Alg239-R121]|uniref:hypothetical protein n=1 Tax=Pelagibius sp. Alg239-R121 TaxID=2993448 RepID=UPI0024A6CE47|nr:hypothetical protein [Pelagibius sp. Alg239-R121]